MLYEINFPTKDISLFEQNDFSQKVNYEMKSVCCNFEIVTI